MLKVYWTNNVFRYLYRVNKVRSTRNKGKLYGNGLNTFLHKQDSKKAFFATDVDVQET